MTRDLAIEVSRPAKSYGQHAVLRGVDLAVPGQRVLAARPERRRQDHHRPDPGHADRGADGGPARVAGSDIVADRAGCAGGSASPASTPPWTARRPARRTCA